MRKLCTLALTLAFAGLWGCVETPVAPLTPAELSAPRFDTGNADESGNPVLPGDGSTASTTSTSNGGFTGDGEGGAEERDNGGSMGSGN